jgi:hypothetical protein
MAFYLSLSKVGLILKIAELVVEIELKEKIEMTDVHQGVHIGMVKGQPGVEAEQLLPEVEQDQKVLFFIGLKRPFLCRNPLKAAKDIPLPADHPGFRQVGRYEVIKVEIRITGFY